jgi:regulator of sigma E protease
MMNFLYVFCMAFFAIILMLICVIGLHELGHAIAARYFHIKIKQIAIGFGKPLMQWRSHNGTLWVWGRWPFGGYVQLLNSRNTPVAPEEYPLCFDKKPVGVRIIVLLAGACANVIAAWLILVMVFLIGISTRLPIVQSVQPQSIAQITGILPGDHLVSIGGNSTPSWTVVGMQLVMLWGEKDINLLVRQSNNELKTLHLDLIQVRFKKNDKSLLATIGIVPDLKASKELIRSSSLLDAMSQTNTSMMQMLHFFVKLWKQLFLGIIPFSILLGPVGLVAVSVTSLTQGIVGFMVFIANLSIAVALMNLLPVPGLDGGSIVYAFLEKLRAKPVSVALEILLQRFALIAGCILFVQLVLNDLQRIYS